MKKEKFTPGPWRFQKGMWNTPDNENRGHSRGSIVATGAPGTEGDAPGTEGDWWYIARVDNAPEEVANARLIAAAPEMYEALERITQACHASVITVRRARIHATAVLAKARGEA